MSIKMKRAVHFSRTKWNGLDFDQSYDFLVALFQEN